MNLFHHGRTYSVTVLPFLVILVVLGTACSSPYEYRKPGPPDGIELADRDNVTVYRLKNSTVDQGTSFADLKNSDQVLTSEFLINAFPQAHKRLQKHLVSILKKKPRPVRMPAALRSKIVIPYRFPTEDEDIEVDVFDSKDNVDSQSFPPGSTSTSSDHLHITGRVRSGVVGMGIPLEEYTRKVIPRDHVYFRVDTSWRFGWSEEGGPVTTRIIDDVLVNFVNYPDKIHRMHLVEKTFDRLLKRVAWRVASQIIPHEYDTSFAPSNVNLKNKK